MGNLVLGSDGTGGTLTLRTNVARLIELIDLDPAAQTAWYDPGVGTTSRRRGVSQARNPRPGLTLLPAPDDGRLRQVAGQAVGAGLKENVRSLYQALATAYTGPDDHVFLFGFSRGAFTVRALAGLLYRCGLAHQNSDVDAVFERSWALFTVIGPGAFQASAAQELREQNRPGPIHFLGLWDTVKTYGGLYPVILPHLRHNPLVTHVRHALALDEPRALFKPTTWGRLDEDLDHSLKRVPPEDRWAVHEQDILEVWFSGVHDDVGSGLVALRWMLGEAVNVPGPLVLNQAGRSMLAAEDPAPQPPRESWTLPWRILEKLPRLEPDNSGEHPRRRFHIGSDGVRDVHHALRERHVTVHASAADQISPEIPARVVATRFHPGD